MDRGVPSARAAVLAPLLRERPAGARHRPAARGDLAVRGAGDAVLSLDGQADLPLHHASECPRLRRAGGRVVVRQVAADDAGMVGARRRHGARVGSAARRPPRRARCSGAFRSRGDWSSPPRPLALSRLFARRRGAEPAVRPALQPARLRPLRRARSMLRSLVAHAVAVTAASLSTQLRSWALAGGRDVVVRGPLAAGDDRRSCRRRRWRR